MTALAEARALISAAREAYSIDYQAAATLTECLERLDQPLRVALAGSLKAGKSTLLNALVGQDIAPTDATECTKVVTWYRSGSTPSVTAWYDGDRSAHVPVQRRGGRLTFDLGELTAAHVDRLDVEWPARTLTQTTIIDTPGTSSLSPDVSERSLRLLVPPHEFRPYDFLGRALTKRRARPATQNRRRSQNGCDDILCADQHAEILDCDR